MHRRGSASETSDAGRKGRGRRPATTPEHRRGGCIRGGGAVGPRVAPEAMVPAREQNRLTMLREGEVRVPVAIAHTPEDVGHGP